MVRRTDDAAVTVETNREVADLQIAGRAGDHHGVALVR
jgi:hypothetical protein